MGLIGNIFKMFGSAADIVKVNNDEKICFQNMMMTPNNETVSAYIEVSKRMLNAMTNFIGSQEMTTGMQMKYINAYKVVKQASDVSEELKAELGRVFLALGIAISLD